MVTKKTATRVGAAIGALVVLLGATAAGCEKVAEPWNDAKRSGVENTDPVDVITNADGFSNVSTKCDHGNRPYVAYHGDSPYAAIAVVPADPTCRK